MKVALRLALSVVLAILVHALPGLASSLPSVSCPEKVPTTDTDIHTQPSRRQSVPQDLRLIGITTSNTLHNITGLKKYIFPVRDSNIVLTISLGKRLNRISLSSFLEVAEDYVSHQSVAYGPNTVLPLDTFEWDMGEDLEIIAITSHTFVRPMTWLILRDAIKGMQEFLIGLKNYREASCRVYWADASGLFTGHVNLRRRLTVPKTNVARDIPNLTVADETGQAVTTLEVDGDVQLDLRPQRQRLDYRGVRNLLVVTRDWAKQNIERSHEDQTIDHGRFERSLGEGVQISMVQAPSKRLTYGLVLEIVEKLLFWEMFVSRGKAVDFGILENHVLKGVGSITKEQIRGGGGTSTAK
ncbi:MAG: hypothetical protein Q9219_003701 [cf. Caloplaca sp. 3 TL-2023]